ncbi:MAG: helix-turn-helix domain-containing protein [Sciscionella sp.]
MGQARQTFERRQLGLTLRRLRDAASKPQQVAADALGKVRSRIVSLEEGTTTASEKDLGTLLDCYGVLDEAERRTVFELGAQARKRQKRQPHYDLLPGSYQRLVDLEASASEINSVDQGIIPGMLQSPDYLQALFPEGDGVFWGRDAKGPTERMEFRQERQARILNAEAPPIMRYVITEDALYANMGSPDVMAKQLRHILTMLDEHPDLTVRVLRTDTYGNPLRGNGLQVFGFGGRGAAIGISSVAFGPPTYFDEDRDVRSMLRAFHRVWELALSRDESQRLIETTARKL